MADQTIPPNQEQSQDLQTTSATSIRVTVRDRKRIIFDKEAKAVTARNDTGTFDILPQHANFISLINESLTVHTIDGKKATIPINNGVMKVKANGVHCYINLLSAQAQHAGSRK